MTWYQSLFWTRNASLIPTQLQQIDRLLNDQKEDASIQIHPSKIATQLWNLSYTRSQSHLSCYPGIFKESGKISRPMLRAWKIFAKFCMIVSLLFKFFFVSTGKGTIAAEDQNLNGDSDGRGKCWEHDFQIYLGNRSRNDWLAWQEDENGIKVSWNGLSHLFEILSLYQYHGQYVTHASDLEQQVDGSWYPWNNRHAFNGVRMREVGR